MGANFDLERVSKESDSRYIVDPVDWIGCGPVGADRCPFTQGGI